MKLLDLYCGAGLAALGYIEAGFEVTGVDIEKKSTYTGHQFIQEDAIEILQDLSFCRQFDAIHASPPCQMYSRSTAPFRAAGKVYQDLIAPTREGLELTGLPYVIENVPLAPIRADITLYGYMFGLPVIRRRHFELGRWFALQIGIPAQVGSLNTGDFISIFGKQGYRKTKSLPAGWRPKFDQGTGIKTWHYAMGIPEGIKFKGTEISEGIPPAYTKYIGGLLKEYLEFSLINQ